MKKFIEIVLLLAVGTIGYLYPQTDIYRDIILNENQQKILLEVLNVDGHINKKMHDDFWKDMKEGDEERIKDKDLIIPLIHKLQYTIWQDTNTSLHLKKVYISKELEEGMTLLKKRDYTNSYNNIIAVINAAATGQKVDMRGSSVYITEELINHTLNGLDASMERFKLLADKNWFPKKAIAIESKYKK